MPRNNSAKGSIIGLMVFLGFGAFFLFGGGIFRIFSFVPFFPMIIVIVIIGIAGAASAASRRSTCCSPNSNNQYSYSSQEIPRSNPYIAKPTRSTPVRQIYIEDVEPEVPKTNFCQYCGTKKDRNAVYCYNCGTKM
jgi:hypothetical protein